MDYEEIKFSLEDMTRIQLGGFNKPAGGLQHDNV